MNAPPAGFSERAHDGARPGRARTRPAVLLGAAVASAAVIGGGAFAVTQVMAGAGDQPSAALPAGTAAYLRMDIDPGVGQKIAALRFLDGLDSKVVEELRSGDLRREAFEALAEEDEAFAGIDYDRDIAPWIGDRMALGVVPTVDAEPVLAVVVQVADEEAAAEGLDQLTVAAGDSMGSGADVAWFFHAGYAVLSSSAVVDTLEQDVRAGTLAADETFVEDMAALGDEGVLSLWADGNALAPHLDSAALDGTSPLGSLGSTDAGESAAAIERMLGGDRLAAAGQGRVAAAVRFAEGHIELHGVTRGMAHEHDDVDTAQLVLDLPEDTAVAVGLEHGDQWVARAWEELGAVMPEDLAALEAEASADGWSLPGDLQTLVGESLTVSVGPEVVRMAELDAGQVPVAYRVQTDTDEAGALLDRALGDSGAGDVLARSSDGGVLSVGLDPEYVDRVVTGGSLGGLSTFQDAVPHADDAGAVLYVSLDALEQEYLPAIEDPQLREAVEKAAAVGMSARWAGDGTAEFTARLVAN